ncbi:ORF13 [Barthadenovirus mellis]|uniref:ORF13 n=1 Tax=Passerine adenovirus 1 TaxID=2779174 RepID=A0A7L9DIV5_9ADEN|nr:ORF13 [Passerine adenovirus 1]
MLVCDFDSSTANRAVRYGAPSVFSLGFSFFHYFGPVSFVSFTSPSNLSTVLGRSRGQLSGVGNESRYSVLAHVSASPGWGTEVA